MTAVTITSSQLQDQNSSEKLSICECAKFWNNLKLETFIIHRLRASWVDGHRNYTAPAGSGVVRNKTGLFYGLRVEIKIVLFYAVILLGLGKKYLQSLTSGTFLLVALPIRHQRKIVMFFLLTVQVQKENQNSANMVEFGPN